MLSLKEVTIHKFKCIESEQTFEVGEDITVLVGMNESGKTSILEALAKTNYFSDDEDFKFNATHDYPRKEKKKMDKSGVTPSAVTCKYSISQELLKKISQDVGDRVFSQTVFSRTTKFNQKNTFLDIKTDFNRFISAKTKILGISSKSLNDKLFKVSSLEDLKTVIAEYKDEDLKEKLSSLKKYLQNDWKWSTPLDEYISRMYLHPNLPKFLYYDEYYALPSRINIEKLKNEQLESGELKTAKALFELADININELINADDFEDFKAELEATEATITEEIFKYWKTNQNLEIKFDIDKQEKTDPNGNRRIVEHILDIRVRNNRSKVSLPLKNRSKGFNWFFSFLVWFKKIQEDADANYVLLLDEPGLNLHASAQGDLLEFIEHLSKNYQILYSTHSPFMVEPTKLERVRTIVETLKGSVVSDSIQEKDPNTLFPLQAALGYDIAQNLFISKNNLLVEGVSDLIYLQIMAGLLQEEGRGSLREDITIVPVGGLEKVSTFVSLLRGNKLNIACLLDSSINMSSKSSIEKLIKEKIIQEKKIVFFDEFVPDYKEADIEDIFTKTEYLTLFNEAFSEKKNISEADLNPKIKRIILQINKKFNIDRFNHYRPANNLARKGVNPEFFSEETRERFENIFNKINLLF